MPDAAPNRFVIQHHTGHGPEHWDLMLEDGDALATWQLDRPPTPDDTEPIRTVQIANHRKAYLTYEGPVSRNRGHVTIHDAGTYVTLDRTDEAWTFDLTGTRIKDIFVLQRCPIDPDQPERWELQRTSNATH